jgi:uncharacterized protein (TIGR00159 family)
VAAELGWADALDILIVSALVYALIAWMRRSSGALVALGLGLVGALYFGARLLDLELTTRVFQSLAAVSLVVLVVVFQEELRQAFEELAAWVLRRRGRASARLDTREILVASVFDLAREKIGALIVIPGYQVLDRHFDGGVELDGRLSAELIHSLFDPHSDGHDGAVVVENRRVTRFGVHLPLARSTRGLGNAGTRHSAALGLAERTDALCIVVSEERGAVSIAENGRLREVSSPEALGRLLDHFYKDRHPLARRQHPIARALTANVGAKGAAVAVATLLWVLAVPGSRQAESEIRVPVRVKDLPAALTLESIEPAEVVARFRGSQRDLFFLGGSDVRVEIDASLASLGRRTFALAPENVFHPEGMTLLEISSDKIQLSLQ